MCPLRKALWLSTVYYSPHRLRLLGHAHYELGKKESGVLIPGCYRQSHGALKLRRHLNQVDSFSSSNCKKAPKRNTVRFGLFKRCNSTSIKNIKKRNYYPRLNLSTITMLPSWVLFPPINEREATVLSYSCKASILPDFVVVANPIFIWNCLNLYSSQPDWAN